MRQKDIFKSHVDEEMRNLKKMPIDFRIEEINIYHKVYSKTRSSLYGLGILSLKNVFILSDTITRTFLHEERHSSLG
jgi:hypothetical protein